MLSLNKQIIESIVPKFAWIINEPFGKTYNLLLDTLFYGSEENQRMTTELVNIKKIHDDQLGEVKNSQKNEISELTESHKKTIEVAKQKFVKEKNKYEA